ncbi:hypothetical protein LTR27_010052 [Elasticomyces elasticus]|nr:hypothetical protein LTR27_010052 [Elasticomyces elasticus]
MGQRVPMCPPEALPLGIEQLVRQATLTVEPTRLVRLPPSPSELTSKRAYMSSTMLKSSYGNVHCAANKRSALGDVLVNPRSRPMQSESISDVMLMNLMNQPNQPNQPNLPHLPHLSHQTPCLFTFLQSSQGRAAALLGLIRMSLACRLTAPCAKTRSQKESALPIHPDASLIRSPGVDRPKHVGTSEWIHMEQSVLDVFQFKRLVLEHLKVGPNARALIAQSIDKFELDTGQPDSGPTFAKPHCKRLWSGEGDEQQSALMLTLPLTYLDDRKGGRHIVPVGTSDKPTTNHRTLLQMLFPRMGSNVHGQQAHYQSGGHSGYLHVTQLWCIMLNGGNEDDDPVVTARDTLDAAQVRTTTSDSVEDFLVFSSKTDTKLYEACKRMTAAQAFLGPYRQRQSVKMPAASADPAALTSNNVSPDIKGTNSSDSHGSEEEVMKNGLYQSLMEVIWPLTHLFTPSYRSGRGSRASLKFWGAMQAFAISAIRVYLARGARKEDFHTFPGSAYAPWRLARVVKKLLSYQYNRETVVEDDPVPGSNVRMRGDFRLAYREVMLAFLHGTQPDLAVSRRHFMRAQRLLKSSFYEVLKDIPRPPLLTREAVGAKGLLALIVRHCTNSAIPSGADLITLFSQQITALEQEVWSGEPSRAPLKSFRILRNELAAAGIVLQSQVDVLETLEQSMCWRVQYDDYEDQPRRIATASIEAAKDRLDILPSLEALVAELRAEVYWSSLVYGDCANNSAVRSPKC